YYDCTYCDNCGFRDECELADNVNFCEDCKERWTCTIRYGFCMAGHDIECNNGFEPRNDYCDDEKSEDTEC
ncbi:MAG: hypothetical protein U0L38_06915, partial [Bacteroidales bacterium]|nr:hypothetical protein [Bacteroidales bacterium]